MTCLAGRASGGLPLAVDLHQTGDERAVPATLRRGIEDEFEDVSRRPTAQRRLPAPWCIAAATNSHRACRAAC